MNPHLSNPSLLRPSYDNLAPTGEVYLKRFQDELKLQIKQLGINAHIKARFKKFETFFEKLHRDHRDGEQRPITDLFAFRIICPFSEDVHKVEHFLKSKYEVLETIHKGSARETDFGYESIHMILNWPWQNDSPKTELPGTSWVMEVQVRTILQDAWAEVEHELIYKGEWSVPNQSAKRKLAAIAAALTLADTVFQELRVEVREIRLQQEKRRGMVAEKEHVMDRDHMARTLNRSALEHPEFLASTDSKEKIEKYLMHALKCHSHEEYEEAIDFYGRALQLSPEPRICSIIYNHRGMAFFITGRQDEALIDFNHAIVNNDQNFRAFTNKATCFQLRKDFRSSIECYHKSLEIRKNQEEVWVKLGLSYLEINELDRAEECSEMALSLNTDCSNAIKLRNKVRERMIK